MRVSGWSNYKTHRSLDEDFSFSTQVPYKCGLEKHQQNACGEVVREVEGTGDRDSWTPVLLRSLAGKQKAKTTQATALTAEKCKVKGDQLELALKGRLCAGGRREGTSVLLEGDLA